MNSRTRTLSVAAGAMIVLLIATVTYQAGAMRRATAPPISAAVVDLSAVIEGLNQRAESQQKLQTMWASIEEQDTARRGALEQLGKDLEQMPAGPVRQQKAEELDLEILKHQAWMQAMGQMLDMEKALMFQDLYRTIKAGAEDLAAAQGYHVVFVDDSGGDVAFNDAASVSREAQVKQQMASRRMLFVDNAVDVTHDLIERMNNLYNAGQ